VANASKAFDEDGRLKDKFATELLGKLMAALHEEMARAA
jgi:hypothetical protein